MVSNLWPFGSVKAETRWKKTTNSLKVFKTKKTTREVYSSEGHKDDWRQTPFLRKIFFLSKSSSIVWFGLRSLSHYVGCKDGGGMHKMSSHLIQVILIHYCRNKYCFYHFGQVYENLKCIFEKCLHFQHLILTVKL
jgi:hypothetical protein